VGSYLAMAAKDKKRKRKKTKVRTEGYSGTGLHPFTEDFGQDPDLSDLPKLFGEDDEWIYRDLSKKK